MDARSLIYLTIAAAAFIATAALVIATAPDMSGERT